MTDAVLAFAPNKVVSKSAMNALVAVQVAMLVATWAFSPFPFLPTPGETWRNFSDLWREGLGFELTTSFTLNLQALAISTVLSLVLAYSTVVPVMRPVVTAISKLRFLSPIGFTFFFTLMVSSGHQLKVALLVLFVSTFFVTGMADVVASIPKTQFDLARTLRMSEWRVVWEVIILGQMDKAFEVLRQNAAMGWAMLTMVEGISRSEGGIGALLINQNKHFHLAAVLAIQMTILLLGLLQDYGIGLLRLKLFPYAQITLERK